MDWAACVPLVAISESARDQEKLPLNVIDVVYNGIDMSQFPAPSKRRDDYLAWLGRFVPEKGPHLAIEAAKREKIPLVLAGTIDRYKKASVAYFHEQIEPHIDKKHIKYIGPVNLKRKVSLLRRARAFLNPIDWDEPFGMVMVEAMALGCPVISFARGAAPEIVEDGKTGFLVKNLDEMVECLERIDEIDREETRLHVERNFSAQVMAKKYIQVYKNVKRNAS
jgi:glycosyltransferase involved in cell wall biosynthesis